MLPDHPPFVACPLTGIMVPTPTQEEYDAAVRFNLRLVIFTAFAVPLALLATLIAAMINLGII
jgi:hypothetical protein